MIVGRVGQMCRIADLSVHHGQHPGGGSPPRVFAISVICLEDQLHPKLQLTC